MQLQLHAPIFPQAGTGLAVAVYILPIIAHVKEFDGMQHFGETRVNAALEQVAHSIKIDVRRNYRGQLAFIARVHEVVEKGNRGN